MACQFLADCSCSDVKQGCNLHTKPSYEIIQTQEMMKNRKEEKREKGKKREKTQKEKAKILYNYSRHSFQKYTYSS